MTTAKAKRGRTEKRVHSKVGSGNRDALKCMDAKSIRELLVSRGWIGERRPKPASSGERFHVELFAGKGANDGG